MNRFVPKTNNQYHMKNFLSFLFLINCLRAIVLSFLSIEPLWLADMTQWAPAVCVTPPVNDKYRHKAKFKLPVYDHCQKNHLYTHDFHFHQKCSVTCYCSRRNFKWIYIKILLWEYWYQTRYLGFPSVPSLGSRWKNAPKFWLVFFG